MNYYQNIKDELIKEVDKKYNITNLKRYRQFYILIEKGATMWHQYGKEDFIKDYEDLLDNIIE